MKLTLPVYGQLYCGDDASMAVQLYGDCDTIVVRCADREQAWEVYSTFGLIEFDTNDLYKDKSYVLGNDSNCIKYDNIKFTKMTDKELKQWFERHSACFN